MRLILICLTGLLLLIQYPLWLGKGGWLRVSELDRQVAVANKKTADLKARNDKLTSEVQDLKEGTGAVEERARYELGMVKENEIFIQVLEPSKTESGRAASAPAPTPAPAPAVAPATANSHRPPAR